MYLKIDTIKFLITKVNETLNNNKLKTFFSFNRNYNKTNNETYETIKVLDENRNIIQYVSQNKESWKSEEGIGERNYYLFYLNKVIFNRNMLGYHKYLFM